MKTSSAVISLVLVVLSGMMAAPVLAEEAVCPPLPAPKVVVKKGGKVLVPDKQDFGGNLQRSRRMIALILDDLASNYAAPGGGGISSIKAISSTSYIVSLPQEERVDLLTYEFAVHSAGGVSIKRKFVATRSGAGQSAGGDSPGK